MADFSCDWTSGKSPAQVLDCLGDEGFLNAFLDVQEPEARSLTCTPTSSVLQWVLRMPDDVPSIVKRLVGDPLRLQMSLVVGARGRLDVDAYANRRGELRSAMSVDEAPQGSFISLRGTVVVSGIGGGAAAGMARDQVLLPLLDEDFFPLLDRWPSGTSTT